MFNDADRKKAADLLDACRKKGLTLAIAESCTGGLIAALLTEIPGSSAVFECGFVTYSNKSKTQSLGVDPDLIAINGAVSQEVAAAMAQGAKERAGTSLAVSVTGVAGPDGGTAEKPVGTVCIAVAHGHTIVVETCHFSGNRSEIRTSSMRYALGMLSDSLKESAVSIA